MIRDSAPRDRPPRVGPAHLLVTQIPWNASHSGHLDQGKALIHRTGGIDAAPDRHNPPRGAQRHGILIAKTAIARFIDAIVALIPPETTATIPLAELALH